MDTFLIAQTNVQSLDAIAKLVIVFMIEEKVVSKDQATDRTWQHKVPKIESARTKDTELDRLTRPRKKMITTARPTKRKP